MKLRRYYSSYITALLIATAFLLGKTPNAYAQRVDSFPTEQAAFIDALAAYMARSNRAEAKEAVQKLQEQSLSNEQWTTIINQSNAMLGMRMRSYPHFTKYLQSINSLQELGQADKFNTMHSILADITKKSEKGKYANFEKFTNFVVNYLNGEALWQSKQKKWMLQTSNYEFAYNDNIPTIEVEEGSLIGATLKDTLAIYDTGGSFSPYTNQWTGRGGRVTWERAGFDPNNVYAELGSYTIDVTSNDYRVEEVDFYNTKYFNRPIKGSLKDQLATPIKGEYLYPQFRSFETDIRMTNLAPQVEYFGGFGMEGSKIIGFGTETNQGLMEFYTEVGQLAIKTKSNSFTIREGNRINAANGSVALYFAQDSIYHPNLNLTYDIPEKEVRLVRDQKASGQIAFISSYHQMEADIDGIFWKINTPVINFRMVSQVKDQEVAFESYNFFEPNRLLAYRTITDLDPVSKLNELYTAGTRTLPAEDFAKYLNSKYTVSSILSTLFQLVDDGFIFYDTDEDEITIRAKTAFYIDALETEIDYDRINIISKKATQDFENAQLDLESKELLITGVEKVALSDSQDVVIFPYKGFLRVKKNRDMELDGTMVAGGVDFSGKDFQFDYDNFTVTMDTIEALQIYLKDETGDRETVGDNLAKVNTVIQDVTGILEIDRNNNKSGKDTLSGYPKFKSQGNSFIYYDSKKLYDGAYRRDDFFFEVEPFEFADLDDIRNDEVNFNGTMVTAGIFPEFKQAAILQEDYSLGFNHNTEATSVPTYNGKGSFTGTINMSNKGLFANGSLEYLAATATSESFLFLPDSMLANADSFSLKAGIVNRLSFPNGHNSNVKLRWVPKLNDLEVSMIDKPFKLYDDQVVMKGNLTVSDRGLLGKGTASLQEAAIRANDFLFEEIAFGADSSDVIIKNEEVAKVAFDSYNVKSRINLKDRVGEFSANGSENIPISLPYNRFKTEAKEFFWVMDEKLVNIRMPEPTNDQEAYYFESTDPDQGGLKFSASGGVVNLTENYIQVDGIPYIALADAKVRPNLTQIIIRPEAVIDTLYNAYMVTDTATERHIITDVVLFIKGKNNFEGSGHYKFKAKGIKKQEIAFKTIVAVEDEEVEGNYYTNASTYIEPEEEFKLGKRISYKGKVELDSRLPDLLFDGFAKIELQSKSVDAQWFALKDQLNPQNIQIDMQMPIGEFGDTLTFGIAQDMDNFELYPTFITKPRTPLDAMLFTAQGKLDYEAETNIYRISQQDRLSGKTLRGNFFQLNDNSGNIRAEGKLNLDEKFELVNVDIAGLVDYQADSNKYKIQDATAIFDFLFDDDLLTEIGEAIRRFNAEGDRINYENKGFRMAGSQLVAEKKVDEFNNIMNQYGYLPEPIEGLDKSLFFTNLNMVWDTTLRSFRSIDNFGLVYAGDKYVNRQVNGYIEIGFLQRNNYFTLYLETNEDEDGAKRWFFLDYKKGVMSVLSNDPKFNQDLNKIKEKKRRKEDAKRGLVYTYSLAPMGKRNQFIAEMEAANDPTGAARRYLQQPIQNVAPTDTTNNSLIPNSNVIPDTAPTINDNGPSGPIEPVGPGGIGNPLPPRKKDNADVGPSGPLEPVGPGGIGNPLPPRKKKKKRKEKLNPTTEGSDGDN